MQDLLDRSHKDPGLSFEQSGIDYIVLDEAHDYKNLRTRVDRQVKTRV